MKAARAHGTYAAWNAHRRRGEEPCPPCKQAQSDYVRRWRERTGRTRRITADTVRRYVVGEAS